MTDMLGAGRWAGTWAGTWGCTRTKAVGWDVGGALMFSRCIAAGARDLGKGARGAPFGRREPSQAWKRGCVSSPGLHLQRYSQTLYFMLFILYSFSRGSTLSGEAQL